MKIERSRRMRQHAVHRNGHYVVFTRTSDCLPRNRWEVEWTTPRRSTTLRYFPNVFRALAYAVRATNKDRR